MEDLAEAWALLDIRDGGNPAGKQRAGWRCLAVGLREMGQSHRLGSSVAMVLHFPCSQRGSGVGFR